jgi:hypothetical protein
MAAPLRDGNDMIGVAAGAIVADATRPGRCPYFTESGRRRKRPDLLSNPPLNGPLNRPP